MAFGGGGSSSMAVGTAVAIGAAAPTWLGFYGDGLVGNWCCVGERKDAC